MLKKIILFPVALIFVFSVAYSTFAQTEKDVEGSKDHPMISRYEGSTIRAYEQFAYDRLKLATGMEGGEVEETAFEGKVTRIVYKCPKGRSALEVYRNYQMALKDGGFEILYECIDDHRKCMKCAQFQIDGLKYHEIAGMGRDARYLFAKRADSEGDIFVSVHTALSRGQNAYTLLQVVEEKPMDTGKVQVDIDAEEMSEYIDEKGSVRIYGIHFDTDKAKIKEKSEPTLAEIATLLEQNPDLFLGVVGHTDNTGSLEYNMNLSRKRAEAVVDFLISEHGISEDRLTPHGVGPLVPVASNENEDGRLQNRRVELVRLKG